MGVDEILKALGDPTRVAIVEELSRRDDQTLFEICTRLLDRGAEMSRQAVAKHIAVLRDANIVTVSTVGRTSVHRLDREALRAAQGWLSATIAATEGSST